MKYARNREHEKMGKAAIFERVCHLIDLALLLFVAGMLAWACLA